MLFMNRQSFGPESTNPRHRRAFAHAKITKAIETGLPEDKLAAVEAGNAASGTKKGKGLGVQALRTAIKQYENPDLYRRVHPIERTYNGKGIYWSSPDFVRRYKAIEGAIGKTGVSLTKPETDEEYLEAANKIVNNIRRNTDGLIYEDGHRPSKDPLVIASSGQNGECYLTEVDGSVPGTSFANDAAQAIGWNSSWDKHSLPKASTPSDIPREVVLAHMTTDQFRRAAEIVRDNPLS